MTQEQTLIERMRDCEDGYDVLNLDPHSEQEGHPCPCFAVLEAGIGLDGSCWRVGGGHCVIRFQNVPDDLQRHVKRLLDELDWYGEWAVAPWRDDLRWTV